MEKQAGDKETEEKGVAVGIVPSESVQNIRQKRVTKRQSVNQIQMSKGVRANGKGEDEE